jgi:hypothetical protein
MVISRSVKIKAVNFVSRICLAVIRSWGHGYRPWRKTAVHWQWAQVPTCLCHAIFVNDSPFLLLPPLITAGMPCHLPAGRQVRFCICRRREALTEMSVPVAVFFITTPARLRVDTTNSKQTNKLRGLSARANYTDRMTAAKLVSTFEDRGCHVVSATDPLGRILGFLNRSRYFSFQVARQLYSRGWVDPVRVDTTQKYIFTLKAMAEISSESFVITNRTIQ